MKTLGSCYCKLASNLNNYRTAKVAWCQQNTIVSHEKLPSHIRESLIGLMLNAQVVWTLKKVSYQLPCGKTTFNFERPQLNFLRSSDKALFANDNFECLLSEKLRSRVDATCPKMNNKPLFAHFLCISGYLGPSWIHSPYTLNRTFGQSKMVTLAASTSRQRAWTRPGGSGPATHWRDTWGKCCPTIWPWPVEQSRARYLAAAATDAQ